MIFPLFGVLLLTIFGTATGRPDTGQYGQMRNTRFKNIQEHSDIIRINEDTAIGAPIYKFDQVFPKANQIPTAILFSSIDAFRYNSQTGEIILTERLDREVICPPFQSDCTISLNALFTLENSSQRLLSLTIDILDQNDLAPEYEIPFSGMTVKLCYESIVNGMSGDIFLANDNDKNTNLRYSVKSSKLIKLNELDEMNPITGEIESHLELNLDQIDLERDLEPTTQLIVQVSDGTYQMERPVLVKIDQNCQEQFKFTQKSFQTTVEENVANINTGLILTSTGSFDRVQYHLIDPSIRDIIRIDAETGEVFLDKALDYEIKQRFRTIVELRDIKTGSTLDFATLELIVNNVNDNAPQIKTIILESAKRQDQNVFISESHPVNVALVYFAISDGDLTNRPGEFVDVKQILGEEYFTLQSGFLILKKSLDRENQNFIQVAISACDQGRPKKCSTTEINFIVTDENDHTPIFTNCPTKAVVIAEDSTPGKLITIVRASDKDYLPGLTSVNGELKYYSSDSIISVDPKSGRVFLNEPLDRELRDSYEVAVVAKDGGSPSLESKCIFQLEVSDVNDNAPVFINSFPDTTTISSQAIEGEIIYQINATDNDLGVGGMVKLEVEDNYGLFAINHNGQIYLQRNLTSDSYMIGELFNVKIIATDGEGLVTTGDLLVEVLPVEIFLAQTDPAVLSGALAGLCLVFLVLVVIIVLKCCYNRKRSTYEMRKAEHSAEKEEMIGSKQSLSGWTVEISGSECGNLKTGLVVEPTESEATRSTGCLIKGISGSQLSRDGHETARDSGRGESEKESINSSTANGTSGGVNCTKECQYLGHSDKCWMPADQTTETSAPVRSSRDESKFEIETLNSFMIGYSKQGFNRLSQTVLDKQTSRQNYQLPSDIREETVAEHTGSSGYESSDCTQTPQVPNYSKLSNLSINGQKKRTVHYL